MRACFCSSVIRLHPDQEKAPQRCYPHGAGCDRFDLDRASTGDLPGLRRSIFRSGPIAGLSKLVIVEGDHLVPRPAQVSWEQAGALFVAGTTAYAAAQALSLKAGDTVVVSGAAGGVGSIAVQLARNVGAKVIGLASAANHAWLADHGVIPIAYGEGLADRIRAASGDKIDAFIDTFGGGYVDLALELGVAPDRFDTIIDFAAAAKHGVKTAGNAAAANAKVLAELAVLIDAGGLEIPIAKVYRLADVRDAYRHLARRHTRGKIVLVP